MKKKDEIIVQFIQLFCDTCDTNVLKNIEQDSIKLVHFHSAFNNWSNV